MLEHTLYVLKSLKALLKVVNQGNQNETFNVIIYNFSIRNVYHGFMKALIQILEIIFKRGIFNNEMLYDVQKHRKMIDSHNTFLHPG